MVYLLYACSKEEGNPPPREPLAAGTAAPEAAGRRGWGGWGAAPSHLHPLLTRQPARERRGVHSVLFLPTIHGPAHLPLQHHPSALHRGIRGRNHFGI